MSLEKLLERIADALEANAKAQAEHTEALKKYVLKVEGGQVSAPADDEKAKAKAKAKKAAAAKKAAETRKRNAEAKAEAKRVKGVHGTGSKIPSYQGRVH